MGGGVNNLAGVAKNVDERKVVYEDQVNAGHKRLDVSDEVELDELIEEPEVPEQADQVEKVKVKGGKGHVKIIFCNSWNYKGTFVQLKQLLE